LYKKGRIDDAIGYWKRSLQADPKQPKVCFNLGFALSKKGDISQAIEYYQKAVQLKPDYYQAHTNLAMLLAENGKTAEAIPHWTKSLEIKPRQADAQRDLGMALLQQNKIVEAVSHLKESVNLKPNQPDTLNYLARTLAAYGDGRVHNPNEAIRFAQNACQLTDYKDIGILDTLAAAYAAAGKFDDAAATAQKAVDLALSSGQEERAQTISKRLELYKAGKPYFEQP
jgi:tetratricopeptide (TPR) repeat protein